MNNYRIHPVFTFIMWAGVVIIVGSFIALLVILGFYFAGATAPVSLFWLNLFAFPIGFILLLIYLIAAVFARRRSNRYQPNSSERSGSESKIQA